MAASWLNKAVSRQRTEMRLKVGYMKLCVDRYLNCDWDLVTCNCV